MKSKQNNQELALLPNDTIENVKRLISESAESLLQAAQMLRRIVSNDPDIVERLSQGPDGLPEAFINGMLRVAEGALHPRLLLNRCPSYRKIAMLPFSAQESAINKGTVEVVIDAATGDTIKIDLVKLDGDKLRQVISPSGIRSKQEQQAWMRRQDTAKVCKDVVGPAYQLKKDSIFFMRDCVLTRVEILRLLEQIS